MEALNGTACIKAECSRCGLMVYDFTDKEREYEKRLEMVRIKWNQLAHVEEETRSEDKADE